MKKLLIVLAMCGLTMGASAQETTTDPVQKYSVATNSFWSNWFILIANSRILVARLWHGEPRPTTVAQ